VNTCKTCKWWKEEEQVYSDHAHMVCDYVDTIHNEGSSSFEVYAEALDDSGMEIALVTGPDFGCIHWEEK